MGHIQGEPGESRMETTLKRAAMGDRDAMASIVGEHYASVYRFCARRLGPELAQDAAQETFLTAQKSLKRFEERSKLSTWLFGIAHNHCRALARKRKMEIDFEPSFEWGTTHPDPASQAVDRECLRSALGKLTTEHREVVVLHELEELTYEEIATILTVPIGTVKSRLNAAFQNLRRLMGVPA